MAFESLTSRLQEAFRRLRGKGKLTEKDVDEALREIRLALLEADVNYRVVKDFVGRVKEAALGQDVLSSLTPGQQVIKIVHEKLVELLGQSPARLEVANTPPSVYMLVGLQGAGKTTASAKLAYMLRRQGRKPLLASVDVYRPAAVEQLKILAASVPADFFPAEGPAGRQPLALARQAVGEARRVGADALLLDTAGRLQIDEEMMQELADLQAAVQPQEILLVVDAMTGQDAVNVAKAFQDRLGLTGVILSKLDGDTRGGAALSIRAVTGTPIKFASLGEKLDTLEAFHPDRMATRILGMGDVLTLIEKAQATMDAEKARALAGKMARAELTLDDFLEQLQQMRRLGPLDQILGMLPGFGPAKQLKGLQVDEQELSHVEAIIRSMTVQERRNPAIIDGSRRRRIAAGSGTRVQDVNRLLKQFEQTRQMLKQFGALDKKARRHGGPGRFPLLPPDPGARR